jgi:two-component system, NtrC family, response regulator HydG
MNGTERSSILVVDDARDTVEVIERSLTEAGFEVLTAPGVLEAIRILEARSVDVVVTDLKMPRVSGMDLVRHVRGNCQDTAVVVITGYPSVEGAVEAIKAGAENFLPKPFTGEELLGAVKGALEKLRGRRVLLAGAATSSTAPNRRLIGASESMRRVIRAIERCAAGDMPVFLVGARGTGKKLTARTIHYSSRRAGEPFIPVDLSAIPDEQAERELFGASSSGRGGLLAAARSGTIYLENVERATPSLQESLARSLAAGDGHAGPRPISASVELVLALAKRSALREDLLRALSSVVVEMPALRDRGDDVLALAAHFAAQAAARLGRAAPQLSDEVIQVFRSHAWPGQVSELQGVIEQLVLAGKPSIDVTDLPAALRYSVLRERAVLRSLAEVEREHIENVMAAVGGNRSRAAEILGINRKTLREKMKTRASGEGDPEGEAE